VKTNEIIVANVNFLGTTSFCNLSFFYGTDTVAEINLLFK
jgi:hypothetical protein